ncbi:lipopolysaccharide biosynthesis protein [Mariniflexile jejuense]|uniref:Lipopolysaccharide biosynthesis protein n=1 Tax=Mariniflexile jejuense TaxID=1173582 RepID=A0ABW3JKA0_9FLAO
MTKDKILKSNVLHSLVWRALNMILMYLTVPFLLLYLGDEYYGVWVTIYGLFVTIYFMDIGISLGLKNKLTEALTIKDYNLANIYISTAYLAIFFMSLFILAVGACFIFFFKMNQLFNIEIEESKMKLIILINLFLVVLSVSINIYKSLYMAIQKSYKNETALAIYQALIFLGIILLPYLIKKSLVLVSLIYGITNIAIGLIFTALFFYKNKHLKPKLKFFRRERMGEIMGLGINFFVIQLSLIIILSTDNIIITYFVNPESTTVYSIVYKIFQPFLILSSLIFTPLWTLFTDAYKTREIIWIKKTLFNLNILFIVLFVALILVGINIHWIIKIWIGKDYILPQALIIFMIAFILIRVYGDIYMTFLNGIGKIKLQMWLYLFGAIINIPLSILFVKYYGLGSSGVILATCLSLLGLAIFMPIQALKTIKKIN